MYIDPEPIRFLLEKCTALLTKYCLAFKMAGAHGIIMAEPVAGTLSPGLCDEFSSRYIARVVEAVQDDSFMFILHNCGDTNELLSTMQSTGARGIHLGNRADIVHALTIIDERRLVFGNIDPVSVFRHGSTDTVRHETQALLERTSRFPNFVLSSGCDVPRGTPIENVDAFYDALKEFNARQ
jgi:uroporphyrinogen decarboxylase